MPRSPLLCLLAVLVCLASPRPTEACGNTVERHVDLANSKVQSAERLLARGKHQQAVSAVVQGLPRVLEGKFTAGITQPQLLDPFGGLEPGNLRRDIHPKLFHRGQRIIAFAIVGSKGAVRIDKKMPGKTERDRSINLAWAVHILRMHHSRDPNNALLTSELAAAMALIPVERPAARGLLQPLAEADRMPTAKAWALLAELERDVNDAAAADRALARCEAIASDVRECKTNATS